MPSIIVVTGPSEGDYYPLEPAKVVVGRDAKCAIQIVDEQVSRIHLEIRFNAKNGSFAVADLDSANGVLVNGHAITSPVPLVTGDLVELGASGIMFFDEEFPDRKSAWEYYKIAGQRSKATQLDASDRPPSRGLGR